jgi:hypothetical protein
VRAYNILKRMGVDTIEQFQNVSANDLNTWTRLSDIAPGLPAARQIADAQAYASSLLEIQSALVAAAREWLSDCDWRDVDSEHIERMPARAILRAVERHYEGGLSAFAQSL